MEFMILCSLFKRKKCVVEFNENKQSKFKS